MVCPLKFSYGIHAHMPRNTLNKTHKASVLPFLTKKWKATEMPFGKNCAVFLNQMDELGVHMTVDILMKT